MKGGWGWGQKCSVLVVTAYYACEEAREHGEKCSILVFRRPRVVVVAEWLSVGVASCWFRVATTVVHVVTSAQCERGWTFVFSSSFGPS